MSDSAAHSANRSEKVKIHEGCSHLHALAQVQVAVKPVCEDCVKIGASWVHLRTCQTCGGTRCCDSSPNRHATKHFLATHHAIMQSLEPGEHWGWCYIDQTEV